jgi:hypothetical protein
LVRLSIVSVTALELLTVQVPPLLARVIVTVLELVEALAEQFVKPLARFTVGLAGIENNESNTSVIVSPESSAPDGEVVKPTVQFEEAPPVCGEPAKVTAATIEIGIGPAGLAATVSSEVATVKVLAPYEPAAGLVSPAIESVAAVELASAQVPPLLARVIVTVLALAEAVAAQLAKPLSSEIVGLVGMAKAELKATVMVLPADMAPVVEGTKPTVQVARVFALCGVPAKVTMLGAVPVAMVTVAAGFPIAVS